MRIVTQLFIFIQRFLLLGLLLQLKWKLLRGHHFLQALLLLHLVIHLLLLLPYQLFRLRRRISGRPIYFLHAWPLLLIILYQTALIIIYLI